MQTPSTSHEPRCQSCEVGVSLRPIPPSTWPSSLDGAELQTSPDPSHLGSPPAPEFCSDSRLGSANRLPGQGTELEGALRRAFVGPHEHSESDCTLISRLDAASIVCIEHESSWPGTSGKEIANSKPVKIVKTSLRSFM